MISICSVQTTIVLMKFGDIQQADIMCEVVATINHFSKIKHDSYPSVYLYWVHTLAAVFRIMNLSVTR